MLTTSSGSLGNLHQTRLKLWFFWPLTNPKMLEEQLQISKLISYLQEKFRSDTLNEIFKQSDFLSLLSVLPKTMEAEGLNPFKFLSYGSYI